MLDVEQILAFIASNEVLAYDTETTGLNVRKDRVMGFGISNADQGYYVPTLKYNKAIDTLEAYSTYHDICVQRILQALAGRKLLMFNASFDARITKADLHHDLLPALYADVLLLKHTCDEDYPFALKEIATKLWGHDVKKEKEELAASIKANGGTAKQFYKADAEILGRYCLQDCKLTYKLFNHYSADLRRQGLETFYYDAEVMPLYKEVTIPMEERGIALDMPLLTSAQREIVKDLDVLDARIHLAIHNDTLPIFVPWILNKDYPLTTFKSGKPSAWTKIHKTQLDAWHADNPTGYMLNLLSKHHLKKLFFDTLKEQPLSRTPTGLPQVDEAFLESMVPKYAWVQDLITFNKLTKLKSTYIDRFLEEQEDGRFYPSFMQHRTVSGRYGSDLQQLPRVSSNKDMVAKYTNLIRSFFVSDLGSIFVDTDYASLEPRIFAHVSGDPKLIDIFTSGKDFYTEGARMTEGLIEVSKEQRQRAKGYMLGIAYGMTGYKLQFELNVPQEQADALVQRYLRTFEHLHSWMNASRAKLITAGTIKSEAGRVRRMPRAKALFQQYGAVIQDSLQLWKAYNTNPEAYDKAKEAYKEFKNYSNNAINFQVQSLAASIVNRAAVSINRYLKASGSTGQVVCQVHDQLIVSLPDDAQKDLHMAEIQRIMETGYKLKVPLVAVPKQGRSFYESH